MEKQTWKVSWPLLQRSRNLLVKELPKGDFYGVKMMGQQRTGLKRLASSMWRMIHRQTPLSQNRTQQVGCVCQGNCSQQSPSTPTAPPTTQPIRNFSLIPGKGCGCKVNRQPLPQLTPIVPQTAQSIRNFSLIPGKGDCKKKDASSKCPKCPKPKVESSSGGCCPHPPPACASVCKSCPPEKKPACPLPTRPPQPCHCPIVMDVKHKPGHCPGPCDDEKKDC